MRAPACLLSLLLVAGCATSADGPSQPPTRSAGPVVWEVSELGRVVSADNQRVRWSYLITLRNTGDRTIRLERLERAIASLTGDSIGGTPTSQPYDRTLGPGASLRLSTSDQWGWQAGSNTTFGGAATLRAITAYRTFSGKDDRGEPVRVQVQVMLDPSVGVLVRPPTAPPGLPAPSVLGSADDLTSLVGLWRGSYRVDGHMLDVPIAATILADGTVSFAENEPVTNRFSRTFQVKDGSLEYSMPRERGSLKLHEMASRRVLVGRVSETEGSSYSIYLEAGVPASEAGQATVTSAPPATPARPASVGSQPDPVTLTGSYRGTVTGTRDGDSYSDRVTVAIVQSGRAFSGTWTTPTAAGTLVGTVLARTNFTFRLRQDTPCAAEFGGLGTIDDTGLRLAASYRGGGCHGSNVAATFVVTREAR